MQKDILAAVAVLAISFGNIAAAEAFTLNDYSSDLPTATVKFADLDLATAKGQIKLERRIHSAITRVCFQGGRDLHLHLMESACRAQALAATRPQVAQAIDRAMARRGYADLQPGNPQMPKTVAISFGVSAI